MPTGEAPSAPPPSATPGTEALVVRLGSGAPSTASTVGGKGASLDRLIRFGWAVPPAFCVTAAAFRKQLATIAAPATVQAWLDALPDATAHRSLVEAFEAARTDPEIHDALASALGTDPDRAWAVRSSALDEDGAVASFAGLHETELGRRADEVEAAVRRCWASLWSAPAIAYRTRRGLRMTDLAMAVVVQELAPAEASAVLFTRHPISGRDDRILLTAIRGLGEPMVSGEATPDTIVVDRATRGIVERSLGRPGMRQFVERGRIVERRDDDGRPALTDERIDELVELALAVEAAAGHPVDIEAALVRGTWFLLQSRPVTST